METLIVRPENKKQLAALKAVMKALNITYEKEKAHYDPEFVAKIQESRAQVKRGETRVIDIDSL